MTTQGDVVDERSTLTSRLWVCRYLINEKVLQDKVEIQHVKENDQIIDLFTESLKSSISSLI